MERMRMRVPVSTGAGGTAADNEGSGLIRIFIGFDPREAVAFSVLAYSIQVRASVPVAIAPLALSQLSHVLTRKRHALQSTDFSFSRFLTPYLSDYTGWSLFMDCDKMVGGQFEKGLADLKTLVEAEAKK